MLALSVTTTACCFDTPDLTPPPFWPFKLSFAIETGCIRKGWTSSPNTVTSVSENKRASSSSKSWRSLTGRRVGRRYKYRLGHSGEPLLAILGYVCLALTILCKVLGLSIGLRVVWFIVCFGFTNERKTSGMFNSHIKSTYLAAELF